VHVALARILADLPGIGKDTKSPEGYSYRGIEAVTRHVQPLMAKHGVVIIPNASVTNRVESPGMKEGWIDVYLSVEWTIYGPDGSSVTATTVGIGRDRADKSTNKAMSQALKYLLLSLFMVSDAKDDAEQHNVGYEVDQRPEPADSPERTAAIVQFQRLAKLTGAQREALKTARAARGGADPGLTVNALTDDGWRETVTAMIDTACETDAPNVTDPADL